MIKTELAFASLIPWLLDKAVIDAKRGSRPAPLAGYTFDEIIEGMKKLKEEISSSIHIGGKITIRIEHPGTEA